MHQLICPKCHTRRVKLGEPYVKSEQWFADCKECGESISLLSPVHDSVFDTHNFFVAPGQQPAFQRNADPASNEINRRRSKRGSTR